MGNLAFRSLLLAGTFFSVPLTAARSEEMVDGSLLDQSQLPVASELKGSRPKADDSALSPAASSLPEILLPLTAPPSLALPDQPSQVLIRELRPLTLQDAERLA